MSETVGYFFPICKISMRSTESSNPDLFNDALRSSRVWAQLKLMKDNQKRWIRTGSVGKNNTQYKREWQNKTGNKANKPIITIFSSALGGCSIAHCTFLTNKCTQTFTAQRQSRCFEKFHHLSLVISTSSHTCQRKTYVLVCSCFLLTVS